MIHNHAGVGNIRLLRYVVLTNKNEYIIHASDNIEAGYRAINLSGLLDEELKDVTLCSDEDTRRQWIPSDSEN
jgi:hypothetical protein